MTRHIPVTTCLFRDKSASSTVKSVTGRDRSVTSRVTVRIRGKPSKEKKIINSLSLLSRIYPPPPFSSLLTAEIPVFSLKNDTATSIPLLALNPVTGS